MAGTRSAESAGARCGRIVAERSGDLGIDDRSRAPAISIVRCAMTSVGRRLVISEGFQEFVAYSCAAASCGAKRNGGAAAADSHIVAGASVSAARTIMSSGPIPSGATHLGAPAYRQSRSRRRM